MNSDFLLETRLKNCDPLLHQRVNASVFVLEKMLSSFLTRFPEFTDHSIIHSMDVLYFCNEIVGADQIEMLTPAECYVIIMSCYLHDVGMGINDNDYVEFSRHIDFVDYFLTHDKEEATNVVRAFHNEYSAMFIEKYGDLFDIPSEDYKRAIIQVAKGHRKTDLYDENDYPDLETKEGIIRTSYLAALLRLADEIDVGSERNPELLFDTSKIKDEHQLVEFGKHESIRKIELTDDAIVMHVKYKSPEYIPLIEELAAKIQNTLDYCCAVAEARTDFRIRQTKVILKETDA